VLLYRFLEVAQDDLERLADKAEQLSTRLLEHPEIAGRVRRIACLDLELGEGNELSAIKRWQHSGG
jgi:predicted nucleic acid-binding protein